MCLINPLLNSTSTIPPFSAPTLDLRLPPPPPWWLSSKGHSVVSARRSWKHLEMPLESFWEEITSTGCWAMSRIIEAVGLHCLRLGASFCLSMCLLSAHRVSFSCMSHLLLQVLTLLFPVATSLLIWPSPRLFSSPQCSLFIHKLLIPKSHRSGHRLQENLSDTSHRPTLKKVCSLPHSKYLRNDLPP